MSLRTALTEALKSAMLAGDAPRTSTIRMIRARLKDSDIAARPSGTPEIPDEAIVAMLRGMVKSRRESVALYTQGNRPELAAKELAEIAVIDGFLPQQLDEAATLAAVDAAIAQAGATSIKDTGRVMALLKGAHGAQLDLAAAGGMVRERLK